MRDPSMSQPIPDRQSHEQDNLIKDTSVSGDLTFAPVQIGTKIETLIVESSIEAVRQRELNKKSPYHGLIRFNFKDRDRFFGRDKLIARLLEAVNRSSMSLVLGASGSGKSSVVRAGLIPELYKSLESQTFYDFIFEPGRDPFKSLLYKGLLNSEKDYNFSESEAEIVLEAKTDTLTKMISTLKKEDERWLIFVDQFEELFTICDDPEKRQNFISALVQVVKSGNSSVKVVLAMRSDFLEQFSFYPDLCEIANQNNIHLVTEMYPDELRQAIKQPAARHGVVFEKGLVEQIIEEVEGQKGYLPLLQYTLDLLWESECKTLDVDGRPEIEKRILSKKSYVALEGVRGALQQHVSNIYGKLNQDEQVATKKIFLDLVKIDETDSGTRVVSQPAYRHEFSELLEEILNKFIKEKLLVSSSEYSSLDKLPVGDSNRLKKSATVEIAHEILLSSWGELKRWLEEEKAAIILKSWLSGETRRWQKIRLQDESKANDELLKGSRLAQAVEFRNKDAFKNLMGFSAEENEFIDASVEWRDRLDREEKERVQRELKQERKARRTAQITTLAVIAGSFIVIVQGIQAEQRKNVAINALISEPQRLLETNNQLEALMASVEALKQLKDIGGKNPSALSQLKSVIDNVQERNRLEKHQAPVVGISFSPDGQNIVSGGADGKIIIWKTSGELLREIQLPGKDVDTNQVWGVVFSRDGNKIASATNDGIVRIWSSEKQPSKTQEPLELPGHIGRVFAVASSQNCEIIASSGDDGTIRLWNITKKQQYQIRQGEKDINTIYGIDFSPNCQYIASTGYDGGIIKIWDLNSKQEFIHPNPIQELKFSESSIVSSVSFSPDGTMLAAANYNGFISIWDVREWKKIKEFHALNDQIYSVTFSPDSKVIASASRERERRLVLWTLTGEQKAILKGHTQTVNQIKFQPLNKNGHYFIASSSDDGTLRLWSFNPDKGNTSGEDKLDKLLGDSCLSLREYLLTNKNIIPPERSHICDNFKTRYKPNTN